MEETKLHPTLKANQWKPGCPSPNPGGRGKRLPITSAFQELAETVIPESLRKILNGQHVNEKGKRKRGRPKKRALQISPGTTFGQAVVLAAYLKAISGDVLAMKLVAVQTEGHAPKRLQVSGTVAHVDSVDIDALRSRLVALSEKPKLLDAKPDDSPSQ